VAIPSLHADRVGKALGKFLLTRPIDIPADLLVDHFGGERAPAAAREQAASL
jgi:hypothetical protein